VSPTNVAPPTWSGGCLPRVFNRSTSAGKDPKNSFSSRRKSLRRSRFPIEVASVPVSWLLSNRISSKSVLPYKPFGMKPVSVLK
jgi:hypothetical protein